MARPTWIPTTDEERRVLVAVERAADRIDRDEHVLWGAIRTARRLGVSAELLASKARRSRATIYRHIERE